MEVIAGSATGGAGPGGRPPETPRGMWADMMGALTDVTIARVRQVWQLLSLSEPMREGPQDVAALAARVGAEPRALHRMLRLLACVGDLAELEPGVFAVTARAPDATHARSEPPTTRPAPLAAAMPVIAERVAEVFSARGFIFSLFTDKPAFNEFVGTDPFTYFGGELGMANELHSFTGMATMGTATYIVANYNFSRFRRVIDIGGGSGALIGAILRACDSTEGVVFDSPGGCAKAARELGGEVGLAGRWEAIPGDFFEAVPEGGDIYLLKSVLHDWGDDRATSILRTCRAAMTEHSRLLVIEPILPATAQRTPEYLRTVLSDLICLLMTDGGRERTETEFRDLLAGGGFEVTNVIHAFGSHFNLIEAIPVR